MAQTHVLDKDVAEYFTFSIRGHEYRFRYLTMPELEKMKEIESDEAKSRAYLFSFISKVNESSPDFEEVQKTMLAPHWLRFRDMIKAEFSAQ